MSDLKNGYVPLEDINRAVPDRVTSTLNLKEFRHLNSEEILLNVALLGSICETSGTQVSLYPYRKDNNHEAKYEVTDPEEMKSGLRLHAFRRKSIYLGINTAFVERNILNKGNSATSPESWSFELNRIIKRNFLLANAHALLFSLKPNEWLMTVGWFGMVYTATQLQSDIDPLTTIAGLHFLKYGIMHTVPKIFMDGRGERYEDIFSMFGPEAPKPDVALYNLISASKANFVSTLKQQYELEI
jgi:hypothetical protein